MKLLRYLFVLCALLGALILAAYSIADSQIVAAAFVPATASTLPLMDTSDSSIHISPGSLSSADTEAQALEKALQVDATLAVWQKPWALDTSRLEPGRIAIKWYADRSSISMQYPARGPESGPVWAITVKGNVRLYSPAVRSMEYDGVTYVIAQKSGSFLGWNPGATVQIAQSPASSAPTAQSVSAVTFTSLTSSACTQNTSGLSFRVVQQPGAHSLPGAAGPVHTFSIEGTGFVAGEKVNIVIKGRVTAPGTVGSTAETVWTDSTFATTIGVAVTQPNTPVDLYVIHRRGVACITVTATQ